MKERFEEYLGEQVGSRPLNNFSIDKLLSLSIETDNNLPFKKKQVLVRFEPKDNCFSRRRRGFRVVSNYSKTFSREKPESHLNNIETFQPFLAFNKLFITEY